MNENNSEKQNQAPLPPKKPASPEEKAAKPPKDKTGLSRRDFLRFGGVAAAATSVTGAGLAGFNIGRSDDAYTGYGRTAQGGDQFFDREPFRVEAAPMMTPVGPVSRPEWTDYLMDRVAALRGLVQSGKWNPSMGVEAMPGDLGEYYRNNPYRYKMILESMTKFQQTLKIWHELGKDKRYAISDAYKASYLKGGINNHYGGVVEDPLEINVNTGRTVPPEEWDFRGIWRKEPLTFRTPALASKLIKRMAHIYGASLVGITRFNPDFAYRNVMRGYPDGGHSSGDRIPEHWKSVIVFAVPMHWDGILSAVPYSTSYDGYFRVRSIGAMLSAFLMELGYPARPQVPIVNYELMMPPYAIQAGLGEQGRSGIVITPELGMNQRLAAVITNIEFEYDKPIKLGISEFCKKCKICAETCPSGAIPFDDEPKTVVRGYKRWQLDDEKCFQQWCSGPSSDGLGCRVCVGVCPYTRKNTWIHTISRELEPRDPTGLVSSGLLAMQQNFFKYPAAQDFKADWDGGKEATYHDPVWWMRSEDFFNEVEKLWNYHGMF